MRVNLTNLSEQELLILKFTGHCFYFMVDLVDKDDLEQRSWVRMREKDVVEGSEGTLSGIKGQLPI